MKHCKSAKLSWLLFVFLSFCFFVLLSFWLFCLFVFLPFCPFVFLSFCPFVLLSLCPFVPLSDALVSLLSGVVLASQHPRRKVSLISLKEKSCCWDSTHLTRDLLQCKLKIAGRQRRMEDKIGEVACSGKVLRILGRGDMCTSSPRDVQKSTKARHRDHPDNFTNVNLHFVIWRDKKFTVPAKIGRRYTYVIYHPYIDCLTSYIPPRAKIR